ncbi:MULTISPECIES: CotH kinase family protein [Paenibacillus]|uniref:CotH kinase family protein n=1 Tax=Paenibacillus TaxID=44249 RepID=UPI0008889248|nr:MULTISPECIES: CotH kinase family protein [Paenibacillus]MCL6660535.1 CotH kinase family protein [Paenibacillus amylolyticus]SDD06659.1 Copper amine oxidase N-terminal domain-containing protein [Paenibacillus sp. CF095]
MNILLRKAAVTALSVTMVTSSFGLIGSPNAAYAAESTATTTSAGVTQAYESLFQTDNVIDVNVTIDDADWKSMLESPLDKDYKNVSVEVDGNKLDNVGFSTKGNLTLKAVASMEDSNRYSFRLKFDKYDKTQTLLGLDKMVLNNNYADPSYMREVLHYEALRSIGMDVPMTNYVNLYVNGELVGFYTGVEAVDDSYLERNYGEDYEEGVLYDTDEKSYLQYEEGSDYSTITKDLGTDKDKTKLKTFIQTLNEMPEGEKGDIESVLDVDSALQYIAGNMVFGNYDSYNGDKGHNYMLYSDADGKFTVVPWDFNMSFNGYSGGGGRGTTTGSTTTNTNATNVSVDEPVLGINMENVPMINNLLAVPEYKEKYLSYVNELTDYMEGIQDRITGLANEIRPYVEADPTKFYTTEQFESNIAYSTNADAAGGMGGTPPEGFEGMTPPEGMEGMTPPEGFEGMTPPDGTTPPTQPGAATGNGTTDATTGTDNTQTRPSGNFGGGGGGMGSMAAGSLTTFALNRLVNLQEQLGREVTPLPETSEETGSNTSSGTNDKTITVTLDGKSITFPDQDPLQQSGRVMVPVNAILEAMGAEVTWDKTAKTVTAVLNDQTLVLKIGSSTATVNGETLEIDVPAIIQNSRTLVPVRFISEGLGLTVDWDQSAAQVSLTSK